MNDSINGTWSTKLNEIQNSIVDSLAPEDGGTVKYAVVLAGHGSRDPAGIAEFEELVSVINRIEPDRAITHGYLEFGSPTISEAVVQAIKKGAGRVVVVPALLFAATHAKNDMPGELQQLREEFPDTLIDFAAAMDLHPLLLQACQERIIAAESQSQLIVSRADTCLVVVGRGSSDPDANSDVSKLTRMLEEGMGFGASFVCYSGTASPLVDDGLKQAINLGKIRLVVLPYLLFDGILVKRIEAAIEQCASRYGQIEVLKTGHLGPTESVARVFLERAREGAEGRAHMNCSLCKYRTQIVGYERQVGEVQKSHHVAIKQSKTALLASLGPYLPHPIEAVSFEVIGRSRSWSRFDPAILPLMHRLVHTTGDIYAADDLFISPGIVDTGVRALLRCRRVVTDVTMVESGLKRALVERLGLATWCGVHDRETLLLSELTGLTRSAAAMRRAWQLFGNDVVLAIGDAPTAVMEVVRLIKENGWRPQVVIALPVGFIGTSECKEALKACLQVPRITNTGTRGGSPWAACLINALMIEAVNHLVQQSSASTEENSSFADASPEATNG